MSATLEWLSMIVVASVVSLAFWGWDRAFRPELYPELTRFTAGEREKVWTKALTGSKAGLKALAVSLAVYFCLALVILASGAGVAAPWGMVVAMPLIPAGKQWFGRRHIQRMLREELMAMGKPVCLKCGYNLTGNVSGRCPECGRDTQPNTPL